jgi:high affinity sulfate transporter 1
VAENVFRRSGLDIAMNPPPVANESPAPRWRLPLFQGILPFDKSRLTPDILAGVTLAALGIPEVMGYTKIIGTPVITGLYTMLLPMLAFALLGSSRHLVVSADSATAAMVAAALTAMSFVANTPQYVGLCSLIALEAAVILMAARIMRLGFLADFLSRTVLVGFLSGVGIQVAFGELHGMVGLEKGGHGFFGHLAFLVQHLSQTQLPYLYISMAVILVIVGFEMFAPRFPGALLAVAGMIVASMYFHWENHGIKIVGDVPSGLPQLGRPDITWENVRMVLPISLSCFIVILAQSAATSRAYALRYRDKFNQNVDLVGLSLANAAAGCSSTFIVNGSPTKTAMVDTANGRSQISHLATVAMVLLVLLFLTKPLAALPNAVLAAIVFLIGVKLFDHRGLAEICRKKPKEFAVAVATAAVVVVVGVEQGIIFALVVSLLQFVRRSYQPHTAVIMLDDKDQWRMEPAVPGKMIQPGLVLYWFGAELFYANVGHFISEARRLISESPTPVKWFVIDASAITAIDFTAGKALKELQQDLAQTGVVLAISRVQLRPHGELERLGLVKAIGLERIFGSRHECLEAFRSQTKSQNEPAN